MPDFPYTKWFWRDWLADPRLKLVSWGARGLWIDMLGLAGISERYGYILINGRRVTPQMLAQVLAGGTPEDAERYDAELRREGVYSVDARGFIYSRRMVKEARKRTAGRKHGKEGGNPALLARAHDARAPARTAPQSSNGKDATKSETLNPSVVNHLPSTTNQKEREIPATASLVPAAAPARDPRWGECYARIEALLNLGVPLNGSRIHAWLAAGADPDLDIIPTIERLLGRRNGQAPPQTLTYFDRAIADALATRLKPLASGTARKETRSAAIRQAFDEFFDGGRQGRDQDHHRRDHSRLPKPVDGDVKG